MARQTPHHSILLTIGIFAGLSFFVLGCWRHADSHCANLNGDLSCDDNQFCSRCEGSNNGCVAAKPSEDCQVLSPASTSTGDNSASTGQNENNTSIANNTTGTTGAIGTTGESNDNSSSQEDTGEIPSFCKFDDDCTDKNTPFCDQKRNACVSCDALSTPNEACAETSDGTSPICSEGQCQPCSFHAQCIDAYGVGCHISLGRCMDGGQTWHVDGSVPSNSESNGSEKAPFRAISEALEQIEPQHEGTIILHEHTGDPTDSYDEFFHIGEGRVIALIAHEFERPRIIREGPEPLIRVTDSNTFTYLEGITIQNPGDPNDVRPGIHIETDATAVIDRCEISVGDSCGIRVEDSSSLTVRNTTVWSNNDFYNNQTPTSTVQIDDEASADISYTTIVNAHPDAEVKDIGCADTAQTTIRNSILISRNNDPSTFECNNASITNSAGTGLPQDKSNLTIYNNDAPPFDNQHITELFLTPNGAFDELDLRLSAHGATALSQIAVRQATDPPFDIDGQARPPVGSPDLPGADIPETLN